MTGEPASNRIVVLGASGQLGGEYLRLLGEHAAGLGRAHANLADETALLRALRATNPNVVINTAAFNQVDLAEIRRTEALAANFAGPAALARICRNNGWKLIHFSTDYVFGAEEQTRPYTERDRPAPMNFYGLTKLMGEQAVLGLNPEALVFRVAHLFGGPAAPNRQNLVLRFLSQARAGQPIQASISQRLNPTPVSAIVEKSMEVLQAARSGLYHLTGESDCSAREYATEVLRIAGLETPVLEPDVDTRPARRPAYSVLDNQRLREEGFPPLPHWRDALRQYVQSLALES